MAMAVVNRNRIFLVLLYASFICEIWGGNQPSRWCTNHRGTFLTFRKPTKNRVSQWFCITSHENKSTLVNTFNHDCVGMTNPCIYAHDGNNEFSNNQKSSYENNGNVSIAWFPPKKKVDGSWRVLRYYRRVGIGRQCYDTIRNAVLDWEFNDNEDKGILRVRKPQNSSWYSLRSDGRDTQLTCPGPTYNNHLVTYSATSLFGSKRNKLQQMQGISLTSSSNNEVEKVTRFRPRIFAVNPVMVVYAKVDQLYGGTLYTSTAYATLKGHWLSGEERVTVAIRNHKKIDYKRKQYVDIEILSHSRPAPCLWGKLVWPFIGPMQSKFFESQMDALERKWVDAQMSK